MARRQLGVFGAPWHPRWIYKHRYFPCVHCMFVDRERVPLDWLDFRPDYETIPGHARQPAAADRATLARPDQGPRSAEAPQAPPYRPLARRQLAHRPAAWPANPVSAANASSQSFGRSGGASSTRSSGCFPTAGASSRSGRATSARQASRSRGWPTSTTRLGGVPVARRALRLPRQVATQTQGKGVDGDPSRRGGRDVATTAGPRLNGRRRATPQCSCSMLIVRLRRIACEPWPCIGRTQCQELKVLTKTTHWFGSNS